MGAEDVSAAIQAAHTAQRSWAALPCKVREEGSRFGCGS